MTYPDDEPGASLDTPIKRGTIDMLPLDELDAWLDRMRTRRLANVQKFTAILKEREAITDKENAEKFDKAIARLRKMLSALEDKEMACAAAINKLRVLQVELED